MVGLTGGVGAGKSAVSALLAGHGAVVIDADAIAREVVEPGTAGFDAVVARFGSAVVSSDGGLDRAAIAAIVFEDKAARIDLNAIVHPLVGRRSAELMATVPADAVVVYDVPLLVEGGLAAGFDCVVVVEADEATRLARLAERGLPEEQARARMAAQVGDEERRAVAHEVINNDGTREALADEVRELWQRLRARRDRAADTAP
ncbi:MAG: dephospho-CoA kinase [Pseudonocardiales bacterium]|jgi:dephospho-CoA kinase|nr:Dephospho-CoA kinase [Pseudonocardiales bacterium]MDT4985870.1 dephospho-CoA kinase [Pseudonocardiales bacterium]